MDNTPFLFYPLHYGIKAASNSVINPRNGTDSLVKRRWSWSETELHLVGSRKAASNFLLAKHFFAPKIGLQITGHPPEWDWVVRSVPKRATKTGGKLQDRSLEPVEGIKRCKPERDSLGLQEYQRVAADRYVPDCWMISSFILNRKWGYQTSRSFCIFAKYLGEAKSWPSSTLTSEIRASA